MAGEQLTIDPLSEDSSNVALDLVDNTTSFLLEHDYPAPDRDFQYASSTDTEGELPVAAHYKNRQVTVKLRVIGSTVAARDQFVGYVQQKIGKLDRECGTLKRTTAAGLTIVFDVVGAKVEVASDAGYVSRNRAMVNLTFECRPFGRGTSSTTATSSETTLPALVFTVPSIPGDVPALGKLVINELQAVDQWWITWGMQSRYYSSAASAALFWQAEALTPRGTAATAVGPTGASGAGSNTLLEGSLTPTYAAVLSTQATGGGAHMTHVGDFTVWARVQRPTTNTGAVSLRLDWAQGDFERVTSNTATTYAADDREGIWTLVDLGQVHLEKAARGTQRWEGRLVANSTVAGDDLYVDCLMFVPVSEGSGQVRAVQQLVAPTVFAAHDEFDQTAGALAAKVAPSGGTWAGAGSATDFAVETGGHTAQRTATADGLFPLGRFAVLGSTSYINTAVQVDYKYSAFGSGNNLTMGVVARYIDTSNWLMFKVNRDWADAAGLLTCEVRKKVAGTESSLAFTFDFTADSLSTYYTLRLIVLSTGQFYAYWGLTSAGALTLVGSGYDSVLATGGALATGKPGFFDGLNGSTAVTRNFDNFAMWQPSQNAALFASQSLEIRHDRVIRADSTGTYWARPSQYEGDYLLVPPAGREGRTARFIVKASRNDPDVGADLGIDDISAALTITPRFLVVPE